MILLDKMIMLMNLKFLAITTLLLVFGSLYAPVKAGKVSILDEAGNFTDVVAITKVVCEKLTGTSKQIAHVSTIPRLADYLQNALNPDDKLFACGQKYLNSLKDLVEVLNTANNNVCGDQKLKLIEDYHQKYVSKVRKHVKNQKKSNKVPKVIKLFFMQYVSEISTRCERAALEMLAEREHELDEDVMTSMHKLKTITDAMGMSDLSKGYDGIYLLWNMVDNLPLEDDKKFSQYLEEKGSSARLNVQLKDPRTFLLVQTICRLKSKPIYSQSILPVLRLTDLGYYPQGGAGLSKDIRNPKSAAHNLFVATQICEMILPLRVYQDEHLQSDQIIALTKGEASQLAPLEVPEKVLEEIEKVSRELPAEPVQKVSIVGLDRLPSVRMGEARERAETIKSTVESRSNVMKQMFRLIIKNMKTKIKSSLGNYLLSRRSQSKLLDKAALENIEFGEKEPSNSAMRRRRETNEDEDLEESFFKSLPWEMVLIVKGFLIWLFKVTLLFIPLVLLLLFDTATFGYVPLSKLYDGLYSVWLIDL